MSVYFFYVFCSPRMRAKVFYMEATAFAFPLNFVEGQRIVGVRLVVVVETTVVQVPRVRRISLTTRPPCAYLAVIILFLTTLLCAVYSKQPPS